MRKFIISQPVDERKRHEKEEDDEKKIILFFVISVQYVRSMHTSENLKFLFPLQQNSSIAKISL